MTRKTMLPYGLHWIDEDDIRAVSEVLRSGPITTGPKVAEFEQKVADYCGAKYAVAMSGATAGLMAACKAAGVGMGDDVITTAVTFVASAAAAAHLGARPVLADIESDTLNIDPSDVACKTRKWTKAIIPVDLAGHPAELNEIMKIAHGNGAVVIEDAAHALGAEFRGKRIGSIADMTVFSLHPPKILTTGEGGLVLTDNADYADKLRACRHHGLVNRDLNGWEYDVEDIGYNFRLTDFQCALGISQLKKLDFFIARRREIARRYNAAFADLPEIITPTEREYVKSVYHIYIIQLRPEMLTADRREIFMALRAEKIGVNVHYIPLHLLTYFQREWGYRRGDFPKAQRYYDNAITLPLFPKMTDGDVQDVIDAVRKVIARYRR